MTFLPATLFLGCRSPPPQSLNAPGLRGDNGEGLAGETDDRIVTFFSPRRA